MSSTLEQTLRDAIKNNRDLGAIPLGGAGSSALSGIERLLLNPSFERGVAGSLLGVAAADLINYFTGHPDSKATPAGHHARYALVDTHNNTVIRFFGPSKVYRLLTRPRGRSRTRKVVVVRQNTPEINVR